MKLFSKIALVAMIATIAAVGIVEVADAHKLPYRGAKGLANKLGFKLANQFDIVDWKISGARRINEDEIDWNYRATMGDGRICKAILVVRYKSERTFRAKAFVHPSLEQCK